MANTGHYSDLSYDRTTKGVGALRHTSATGRAALDHDRKASMNFRSPLVAAVAVLAGLALVVLAVVYWAEPAHALPSFIPGHEAGSSHHHIKHGIASFLVGLALLVFAWFQTGKKQPA